MPAWDFDATSYDEPATKSSFDPLPPGDYTAIVAESDMKDTKAGTGKYIELSIHIVEGPHEGRRLWERLNVYNPSEQAERIARSQLNNLSNAVGKTGAIPHAIRSWAIHRLVRLELRLLKRQL